ncbi:MAG: hypothetical protein JO108_11000 [Acidobacteriaceae bacterium]|nr:hypothetical protein [Acidobacteriaceae bacterium]
MATSSVHGTPGSRARAYRLVTEHLLYVDERVVCEARLQDPVACSPKTPPYQVARQTRCDIRT